MRHDLVVAMVVCSAGAGFAYARWSAPGPEFSIPYYSVTAPSARGPFGCESIAQALIEERLEGSPRANFVVATAGPGSDTLGFEISADRQSISILSEAGIRFGMFKPSSMRIIRETEHFITAVDSSDNFAEIMFFNKDRATATSLKVSAWAAGTQGQTYRTLGQAYFLRCQ